MANSVPTLGGLTASVTFAENTVNATPQLLMASGVTLVDANGNFDGGMVTVSNLLAEDTVAIRNQGTAAGEIGVSGSNVTFGGVTIGTFSGGMAATLTVTFNAAATAAGIEALFENLTYANSSDAPAASHALEIKFNDAAGFAAIAPIAFAQQTGAANPFDGADVGSARGEGAPSFADLDGDGDLDAVVGDFDGVLNYFENTGSAVAPAFTERAGAANPFNGVDMGSDANPSFADLDADGDLDAMVGQVAGTLQYFENTGTAIAPVFVEQTGAPNPFNGLDVGRRSAPSFADLDGDGDLDAVIGENYGTLRYFENIGSAVAPLFTERTGTANPFDGLDVGVVPTLSFADLDGDGDLDAVVGENYGTLRYLENTGSATAPVIIARTGAANPFDGLDVGSRSKPGLADLDGDGDLDAVVGDFYSNGLAYFRNTTPHHPAADFAEQAGAANPFDGIDMGGLSAPSFADLDGDGRLDAIVGSSDGNLHTFKNTGTAIAPVFTEQTGASNPLNGFDVGSLSTPSFADLDGDGLLDAVIGENDGSLHYFHNIGAADAPIFTEQTGSPNPFDGVDVGIYSTPSFADLDGDGDLDAVVGEFGGTLRYFENTGSTIEPAFTEGTGAANPFNTVDVGNRSAPSFVDLDGDGDLDAVVGELGGTLRYFENTGSATAAAFTGQTGAASPFNGVDVGAYSTPSFADLDGDGDLDVLVGASIGTLRYLENTGAGFELTVSVTAENDAASVTGATTLEDTLSASGLVVTKNAGDGAEVTHFKVTNIVNGKLYLNDGTTEVANGAFLEFSDPLVSAGLKFLPNPNFNSTDGAGSFDVQPSTAASDAGLGGAVTTATVSVTPVNDVPSPTNEDLSAVAEDSGQRTILGGTLTGNDSTGPSNESGQTLTVTGVSNVVGGSAIVSSGNVLFTPTADFNGAASFDYTVTDDGTTNGVSAPLTATATASFSVTEINDTPNATNDALSAIDEDSGQRTIFGSTLTINDSAGPSSESGQTLTVTGVANVVGGSAIVSGGNVLFTPTADFNGAASFDYIVTDNGTTNGVSAPLTANATASFSVDAVSDAPLFNGLDNHPTFTENGGVAVVLDANATLSDADLAPTDPIAGATLTLARGGAANPNDMFSSALFDEGQVTSVSSGLVVGMYTQAGGTLTVTFNSDAVFADVTAVVQSLTYANGSDSPPASVQIDYLFNNGEQAAGSITIAITAVNDPPAINGSAPAFYQPGAAGVALSPGIAFTDLDDATLSGASVSISAHVVTDLLSVEVGGSGLVANYVASIGVLALSGTASLDVYRQVLSTVTYSSSDADPASSGLTRTITWQVTDGTDNGFAISSLDFFPAIDLDQSAAGTGFATAFVEGSAAIGIVDSDLHITDTATNIVSASVVLTNAKAGDTLSAPDAGLPFTVDSSVAGRIALTFSGNGTPADFETALRQVVFGNPSTNIDPATRDITVVVSDGNSTSNTAHTIIAVSATDDPGSATNDSITVAEDAVVTVAAAGVLANDNDPDGLTVITGTVATSQGGTIQFTGDGAYTYTPADDFFGTDTVEYTAQDRFGSQVSAMLTMTVGAVNDAALAQDGSASGNEDSAINGTAHATDVDNMAAQLTYSVVGAATHGNAVMNANGTFSYTPDANYNGADSFTFMADDGTADSNTATISLMIGPVNDTPTITSNGGGGEAAISMPENDAAVTTVAASDRDADAALSYSIAGGVDADMFQIDTATGALSFKTAPDFENPTNFDRNNIYVVQVRASDGRLIDDQTITIDVTDIAPVLTGDGGNNTLTSTPENDTINGLGGDDTALYSGNLGSYSLTDFGNKVTISGPDGSDTLFSVEHLRFADGTVHANDGSGVFDTIFYDRSNLDVFHANVDALAHYDAHGWHEGRDPNPFFSTDFYLGANRSVFAAGVNPLDHYHQYGWKEGRDPGPNFDTSLYLSNNPDVVAAGIDPLEYFLQHGMAEGRAAYAAIGDIVDGFDAQYYLTHNPDVAAARVDPLVHFNTYGWHEGRNPNALFDTSGYLTAYGDVAAADVNPLDHYHQYGWTEGRDPSTGFDTTDYLAAYADVAAANIDPMVHFLQNGIHESRSTFGDGVWG